MKRTTKRDLLIKELLAVIEQADNVCVLSLQQMCPEADNLDMNQGSITAIQRLLTDITAALKNKDTLNATKLNELGKYFNATTQGNDKTPDFNFNALAEKQSMLEIIQTKLTYAVRAILRVVDYIVTLFANKSYNDVGETPCAVEVRSTLGLASRSQFFPRPITSVNEATDTVKNISLRLEECLRTIEQEENDEEYKISESLSL